MDLSKLKPAEGATKKEKRIGRGQGSGRGGTSTKGHKGQKAISGYNRKRGFEGGQMPMARRLPKFGFTNPTRVEYKGINLDTLQELIERKSLSSISFDVLVENGLVGKKERVKILGRGEIKAGVAVAAHKFSATAKAAIEAAGGSTQEL